MRTSLPRPSETDSSSALELREAAAIPVDQVLARLGSSAQGLSGEEAARRLAVDGPNVLRSHGARPLEVLVRQLRSYLLLLLVLHAARHGAPRGKPIDDYGRFPGALAHD